MSAVSAASAVKKKARGHRVRLTHIEIRRGTALRIRLAIADDVLGEAGDELGALIRRISPGTVTSTIPAQPPQPAKGAIVVTSPAPPSDFVISPTHEGDDDAYHAGLRERLAELFGSLWRRVARGRARDRAVRARAARGRDQLMPAKVKGPLWYRWSVNYRDARGRIRQEIVESTTHQDAIIAASVMHPNGRDFTAMKLSTRPI